MTDPTEWQDAPSRMTRNANGDFVLVDTIGGRPRKRVMSRATFVQQVMASLALLDDEQEGAVLALLSPIIWRRKP